MESITLSWAYTKDPMGSENVKKGVNCTEVSHHFQDHSLLLMIDSMNNNVHLMFNNHNLIIFFILCRNPIGDGFQQGAKSRSGGATVRPSSVDIQHYHPSPSGWTTVRPHPHWLHCGSCHHMCHVLHIWHHLHILW